MGSIHLNYYNLNPLCGNQHNFNCSLSQAPHRYYLDPSKRPDMNKLSSWKHFKQRYKIIYIKDDNRRRQVNCDTKKMRKVRITDKKYRDPSDCSDGGDTDLNEFEDSSASEFGDSPRGRAEMLRPHWAGPDWQPVKNAHGGIISWRSPEANEKAAKATHPVTGDSTNHASSSSSGALAAFDVNPWQIGLYFRDYHIPPIGVRTSESGVATLSLPTVWPSVLPLLTVKGVDWRTANLSSLAQCGSHPDEFVQIITCKDCGIGIELNGTNSIFNAQSGRNVTCTCNSVKHAMIGEGWRKTWKKTESWQCPACQYQEDPSKFNILSPHFRSLDGAFDRDGNGVDFLLCRYHRERAARHNGCDPAGPTAAALPPPEPAPMTLNPTNIPRCHIHAANNMDENCRFCLDEYNAITFLKDQGLSVPPRPQQPPQEKAKAPPHPPQPPKAPPKSPPPQQQKAAQPPPPQPPPRGNVKAPPPESLQENALSAPRPPPKQQPACQEVQPPPPAATDDDDAAAAKLLLVKLSLEIDTVKSEVHACYDDGPALSL